MRFCCGQWPDVQTKEERDPVVAARGEKVALPKPAGYMTHGRRHVEMSREIEFLNQLKGVKGFAQILGVLTEAGDTTRAEAILMERCECDLEKLLEYAPLPQLMCMAQKCLWSSALDTPAFTSLCTADLKTQCWAPHVVVEGLDPLCQKHAFKFYG